MNKSLVITTLFIALLSCGSTQKNHILTQLCELPKDLKEISGIAYANNLLYSIEDSGNASEVIVFDLKGKIKRSIVINATKNVDWEDLTFDTKGNLYIGDFGNNDNTRRNLAIYKIDKNSLHQKTVDVSYAITFEYPEQTHFPPKKKEFFYDVEGFLESNSYFYLFTKNRSKGFDGSSYIYKIPNTAGHHKAQLIKTINTCSDYQNCAITSAAISPDGTKFVLLSHSKVWLFENFALDQAETGRMTELDLDHFSQKESITFKNNDTLLIADERVKKTGGRLYKLVLSTLKKKTVIK
jgi:hypothetical protein